MEVPSRFEIDDALWPEVEPLIPVRPRRRRYPGRKPLPDRLVLNRILHVLRTGIAWGDLPQGTGYATRGTGGGGGGPGPRVRLRLRGDGVAAPARLAAGRRMGRAAPEAAHPAERGG